jgi:hypothetical protein
VIEIVNAIVVVVVVVIVLASEIEIVYEMR